MTKISGSNANVVEFLSKTFTDLANKQGEPAPRAVFLAWVNRGAIGTDKDADLLYYGGVERVHRDGDGDQEVLNDAMDRVMAKVEQVIRNPIEGGINAGLPVEITATYEHGTGDVLVMYRVAFMPAG